MGVTVKGRPMPFPDLEIYRICKVVGGTNLSANAVVRLVTGKNTSTTATQVADDGVAVGDYFGDQIVALTKANYPEDPEDDGPVASQDRVCPAFLGILLAATNDDAFGNVLFRGYIEGLSLVTVNAEVYAQGGLVFLDASDSFNAKVESVSANIMAVGDIVIGRLAQGFTATGTATLCNVHFNGIHCDVRAA